MHLAIGRASLLVMALPSGIVFALPWDNAPDPTGDQYGPKWFEDRTEDRGMGETVESLGKPAENVAGN